MNGVYPFGDLSYQDGWAGTYCYPFFGHDVTVKLFVPCDEGDDIEATQSAALTRFDAAKPRLVLEAQHAIYRYYRAIADDYRGRLGSALADTRAPVLSNPDDLQALVTPTELIVQQSFDTGHRVIGLLFDCTWEPSLGLAVKFVNETLDAVGTQDIVL
jgi:hypothetical protein